ncbi:MAG: ATP-binding cassette domain-containing protein [Methanobacteriaceae archaeon]|nr:ATP-binding cassette domain-containing protein [Methanobacteriaceae archaeon]
MIKIENLTKIYKLQDNTRIKALDQLSLTIEDNEIYGIMGVSGSGKSSLLRILRGVEPFDEGKIIINDIEITPENYNEKKQILKEKTAIHLQRSFGLWPTTPLDNIVKKLYGLKYGEESLTDTEEAYEEFEEDAKEILETVDLTDKIGHYAPVLSGGEKQRLVLARQLAKKPEILLLDEPATMASPRYKKELLDTIKKINNKFGTTIIIVSHQPEIQEYLCSKTALIYNGKLEMEDNTSSVVSKFLSYMPEKEKIGKKDRTQPLIKINNIARDYYLYKGGHVLYLDHISDQINKSDIFSIVGPSGSGKTMLIRMIAGFEKSEEGNIEILNNNKWIEMNDYGSDRTEIRQNMGFMHQEFALTPNSTVLSQITTHLSPKTEKTLEKAKSKAREIGISNETLDILYQLTDLARDEASHKLEKLNISPEILNELFPDVTYEEVIEAIIPVFEALDLPLPLLNRKFKELSGGQKVRVAIAVVLASNPSILILDEPFGDLDPVTLRIVANSLKKINDKFNTTIIFISHQMDFVKEISTKTMLLDNGKHIKTGNPEEICKEYIKIEEGEI